MADITLLQINDLHGDLEPHPELFELTAGAPWRSGGGLARIASLFGAMRREAADAVIALDNGDTFHGSMPAVQTRETSGRQLCRQHSRHEHNLKDHEGAKAERGMEALLRMKKIDIAELERAVVTA